VIVSDDGLILTTHYNVDKAKSIEVILQDGRSFEAKIVGWHQAQDLALLKIDARRLPTLEEADFDTLNEGTPVALIGRGLDGEPNVSPGIVSALDRMQGSSVQTDCDMNFSTNGGAIVTLDGKLIGIAGHLDHRAQWGYNSGVSFAIVLDKARASGDMEKIASGEKIETPPRPFLGVRAAQGAVGVNGAMIDEVLANSAAEAAGMQNKDVIIEFNGEAIHVWADLVRVIRKSGPGAEFTCKVKRSDEIVELTGELGTR
jgi:serine protease Do